MENSGKPYPKYAGGDYPDGLVDQYGRNLTYQYFLMNRKYPVRFLIQEDGYKIRAEALRWQSGQIEPANNYLNTFQYSDNDDFIEISKDKFYKACDDYLASITPELRLQLEKNLARANEVSATQGDKNE